MQRARRSIRKSRRHVTSENLGRMRLPPTFFINFFPEFRARYDRNGSIYERTHTVVSKGEIFCQQRLSFLSKYKSLLLTEYLLQ